MEKPSIKDIHSLLKGRSLHQQDPSENGWRRRGLPKVVVIGLDGATPDLIQRWRSDLPNLDRVFREGAHGTLESTIPPVSCPAWPSFSTGKNPGKLGVYHFYNLARNGKIEIANSSSFADSCLWTILSQRDLNVGVFCVPGTYPPLKVRGFMVSGFPTPFGSAYTYPPDLQRELDNLVGGFEVDLSFFGAFHPDKMPGGRAAYLVQLERFHEKNMRAIEHLLSGHDFDFFVAVFREIDLVQHYFWEDLDGVVKKWYIELDSALGSISKLVPKECYLFAMSDHGFGPAGPAFRMNEFLRREGFLSLERNASFSKPDAVSRLRKLVASTLSAGAVSFLRRWLPSRIVARFSGRAIETSRLDKLFRSINWKETKAFALGGDTFRIYTNVPGTQTAIGTHSTDASVADEIVASLRRAEERTSGCTVRFEIYPRDVIYSGDHLADAPDLCVEVFRNGIKCQTGMDVFTDSLFGDAPLAFSGIHRKEGFWCAAGPDVQKGIAIDARITDIAPTILWLLNIPVPNDVDGKPLTAAFRKETLPEYGPAGSEPTSKTSTVAQEDDQTKILERLKALGYLG